MAHAHDPPRPGRRPSIVADGLGKISRSAKITGERFRRVAVTIEEFQVQSQIRIRPYHGGDQAQVEALDARVHAYRPEEQPQVEAMYERARRAEQLADRWMPHTPAPYDVERVIQAYFAFWVAVRPLKGGADEVVGLVAVDRAGTEPLGIADHMPLAREWLRRDDLVELKHLRVAPEVWRQRVGTLLSQQAIEWCRERGYRSLVLNTTSPQLPALSLYHKLGFQEVERIYMGKWELVWLELKL